MLDKFFELGVCAYSDFIEVAWSRIFGVRRIESIIASVLLL